MWVLIDNYDSFTFILHHYLLQLHPDCRVFRNDELTVDALAALSPERIILSPGPETPYQAGITMDVVRHFHSSVPILGICLGHQALGLFFGGKLERLPYPMHGKTSLINTCKHPIFKDIPISFQVMRYHSLAISLPSECELKPLAYSIDDHQIMMFQHQTFPCMGIQFHPESVGTLDGAQLLKNWHQLYVK
ncbi:MAG: aminodeoxychorismate/anthranilate synthase component II [Bacteroidetes bacterium]|nr:aminodeoxychorismate/anthranilate synthase component II [Bacteroidota bacterium]